MTIFTKRKKDKFNTLIIEFVRKLMPSRVFAFEPLNTSDDDLDKHCLVFTLNPSSYKIDYDLSNIDTTVNKFSTEDEDMVVGAIIPVLEQLKKDCLQAQLDIEATIDELRDEY